MLWYLQQRAGSGTGQYDVLEILDFWAFWAREKSCGRGSRIDQPSRCKPPAVSSILFSSEVASRVLGSCTPPASGSPPFTPTPPLTALCAPTSDCSRHTRAVAKCKQLRMSSKVSGLCENAMLWKKVRARSVSWCRILPGVVMRDSESKSSP